MSQIPAEIKKLPVVELKGNFKEMGRQGYYDYTFSPALGRIDIYKIPMELTWKGQQIAVPYVLEEDPQSINGINTEAAFAYTDYLGSWHDFGRKGGYTAIDGHSEVLYDHGNTFEANLLQIEYKGNIKVMNFISSLERWPRPW